MLEDVQCPQEAKRGLQVFGARIEGLELWRQELAEYLAKKGLAGGLEHADTPLIRRS